MTVNCISNTPREVSARVGNNVGDSRPSFRIIIAVHNDWIVLDPRKQSFNREGHAEKRIVIYKENFNEIH
jgi:hypothetical protein